MAGLQSLVPETLDRAADVRAADVRAADVRAAETVSAVRERLLFAVLTACVLVLGAIEDWFGTNSTGDLYGSDAVQYLDVTRAMLRGDWHAALNPLWSQGYPALLALVRPLFVQGPWGDWLDTRAVNLVIYALCWAAFCWLLRELLRTRMAAGMLGAARGLALGGAAGVFLTVELTIGQASRTGPDKLVATIFFAVCALMLRMRGRAGTGSGLLLGLLLGVGFLVKAAFLVIGASVVLTMAVALVCGMDLRRPQWRRITPALAAGAVFAVIALGYGAALSDAVGHRTLGESGSINYVWHVNRLAKWVHWEGGNDPAAKAWPKPALARFAHWDSDPPDFGKPLHPSRIVGTSPRIYVFHAPVSATYVPYFDPPYWYEGYKHVFRWRFQAIALAKSVGDLAEVLDRQPLAYAWLLVVILLAWDGSVRWSAWQRLVSLWPVLVCAVMAVAIFLPVHLEGRYLSGALAVLLSAVLTAVCAGRQRPLSRWLTGLCAGLLVLGTVAGLGLGRKDVIRKLGHAWSPASEQAWVTGRDVAALLPAGSEVGMIWWQPSLPSDWAYVAQVRITSEIADGADERAFWARDAAGQAAVLQEFQANGARAVVSWDRPLGSATGWRQLPGSTMWIYRF